MGRAALALLLVVTALPAGGCRRLETRDLAAVRALRARTLVRFRAPNDGLLTDAQLEAYLKVRRAASARSRTEAEAAEAIGADPVEIAWVRARIMEAQLALQARQVTDAAFAAYGEALARLRQVRSATREPRSAARLDAEIAVLERERMSLRTGQRPSPAASRNAARLASHRAELAVLGP